MTTLHTVNKFSLNSPALESCLSVVLPGDAILLLEDGVYDASKIPEGTTRIYAIKPDLMARGIQIDSLPSHVELLDYPDFVNLVCTHHKTVSWF